MGYDFVSNILYLNLNSIFNILNAIVTKHRFLANKSTKLWNLRRVIFLRFWPFVTHFLIKVFLVKKDVQCR